MASTPESPCRCNAPVDIPAPIHSPAAELTTSCPSPRRIDLLSETYVVHDRSLVDNPATILSKVETARDQYRRIAVDDVGTRPESLTLLPLIEPDIIVLAPELTCAAPDTTAARALHVLAAQAERTGAVIVASGVDSERHRTRALALGASFGIGALFPPATVDGAGPRDVLISPTWSTPSCHSRSPFDIASTGQPSAVSTKSLLVEMSCQIESQASDAGPDTMVLGTFQHARQFASPTQRRWQRMAGNVAYTGIYGIDMAGVTVPGIVSSSIDPSDELVEEWNVVVLGQFFCCILSARDLRWGDSELGRTFEYVVSHDRGTVVRCARAVLSRFDNATHPSTAAP